MTAAPPTVAVPRLTVADYIDLPEDGPRYELIDGELFMAPSPDFLHQKASTRLTMILGTFLDERPLGELFAAPFDVYLGKYNALQPDLLYISNENLAILQERVHGAPDLVVEILSPHGLRRDLVRKRAVYQEFGVKELWFVDPRERCVYVQRREDDGGYGPDFRYGVEDSLTTPLLPGLEFPVLHIFERPKPG